MKEPLSRAQTRVRWPMVFRLEPADVSLFNQTTHGFDLSRDYDAAPDVVHRSFLGFVGDPPWSPGFVGVDWWSTPNELDRAVMDELYVFMTMRVKVIEHIPATRSVAYVDRWSLPLAKKMVQLVETSPLPNDRTRFRYRVAYKPIRGFKRFASPVEWAFERWFEQSLRGLDRVVNRPAR